MLMADNTVPLDKEIATMRQLLIKLSELCSVLEDGVIFPWPVELSTTVLDEFTPLCPAKYVLWGRTRSVLN